MAIITLLPETGEVETRDTDGTVVEHSLLNIIEDPQIADPVFKHITETCTTREIAQQSYISKAWKTLVFDNMLDMKNDWYFPLRFKGTCSKKRGKSGQQHAHKWTWSGVHNSSLAFHNLPHIHDTIMHAGEEAEDPFTTFGWECDDNDGTVYYPASTLLAVSGGLLLFGDWKNFPIDNNNWRPLWVYNPLTKQSRELPRLPNDHELINPDVPRNHLVVDMVVDEQARTYKVILTSLDRVFLYYSTSNNWNVRYSRVIVPFAFSSPLKAVLDGKLHVAELEINFQELHNSENMQELACVGVFELDEDAGTWKQSIRVPLRDHFPAGFDGFMNGSTDIGFVECMGGLFAVIPAWLDVDKSMEKVIMEAEGVVEQVGKKTYNDYGYLPLQFYMLPLGGGGPVRQLMVRPPADSRNMVNITHPRLSFVDLRNNVGILQDRRAQAMQFLRNVYKCGWQDNWVQCHSIGSVVRVSFADYLVQYDMVSRRCQTFILHGLWSNYPADFCLQYYENRSYNQSGMAYSPSFYMKP